MKSHSHAHHEAIVVLKGTILAGMDGLTLRGGPGSALLYPAGAVHEESAAEGPDLETLYLGFRTDAKKSAALKPAVVFDRHGRLRVLAQWMHELSRGGAGPEQALLDKLAYAFVREWECLERPGEPEFVQAVRAFIDQKLSDPIALPDLAKAAGLSVSRFAHAFKKETGVSPKEYLRRQRMEHARSLLLSTPLPLKVVAEQCGCADPYVFSKMFRRIIGLPPGAVRKSR